MARRLGDPALLWWASHTAWKALWTPKHGEAATPWPGRGSRRPGPSATRTPRRWHSWCWPAARWRWATGRPTSEVAAGDRAAGPAAPQHLRADGPGLGPAQPRGDARRPRPTCRRLSAELYECRPRLNPTHGGPARRRHPGHREHVERPDRRPRSSRSRPPTTPPATTSAATSLLMALARTDDVERLREELVASLLEHRWRTGAARPRGAAWPRRPRWPGTWRSRARWPTAWRPCPGGSSISGISSVDGPVDGYLALALATCGRRAEASAAAERGLEQAAAWGFTEYAAWLRAWREQLGL